MIAGLTGLKNSGKDTIADFLVEYHGFTKVSFAGTLKRSVAELFNITLDEIEQWKNDPDCTVQIRRNYGGQTPGTQVESSMTFRYMLQRYGTEAHRNIFGSNFWVEQLVAKLRYGIDYVITDVRFNDEAFAITEMSGFIYEVYRPGLEPDGHASENGVDPQYITGTIRNTGTIEQLHNEVEEFFGL
jgi:hypothetical protein